MSPEVDDKGQEDGTATTGSEQTTDSTSTLEEGLELEPDGAGDGGGAEEDDRQESLLDYDADTDADTTTEGADKEEEPEKTAKQAVDVEDAVRKAKEQLRKEEEDAKAAEERKAQEPRIFTEEELDAAEDELDRKLEEEEITSAQHRQYMRRISKVRSEQAEARIEQKIRYRQQTDSMASTLTAWAKEHLPVSVEPGSNDAKEALAMAQAQFGVQRAGEGWWVPDVSGRVLMGMLHAGQKQPAEAKKAEEAGYKRGVQTSDQRRQDMLSRKPPPKSGGRSGADKGAPVSADEREVMERLGIHDIKTYRQIKKGMMSGARTIGVK